MQKLTSLQHRVRATNSHIQNSKNHLLGRFDKSVPDVINPAIFLKIDQRVSELADPEIWHVPLTCLVFFSVKIHIKLSHQLAICRENVQHNRV